jgi:hypothetical protein
MQTNLKAYRDQTAKFVQRSLNKIAHFVSETELILKDMGQGSWLTDISHRP